MDISLTIKIDSSSGDIDVINNKSQDTKGVTVRSKYLLYKISDAGLLESLKAVTYNDRLKCREWIFDNTDEVTKIANAYIFEQREIKSKKQLSHESENK